MSEQSQKFMAWKNLTPRQADEIFIDIDDRTEKGWLCFNETGIRLLDAGYWFQVRFAVGMKEPHILIPKVFNLKQLTPEQNKKYCRAFLKKYIPSEYWRAEKLNSNEGEIPDFSTCEKYEDKFHPIPQVGKPHHKYKTPYLIVAEYNKDGRSWNFTEPELYNPAIADEDELQEPGIDGCKNKVIFDGNKTYKFQKVAAKISIYSIADAFGLSPMGKKMRNCPFHGDENASLSLTDSKGLFNCFGCHQSGNIIKFYALLKLIRPSFKFEVTP